MPTFSAPDQNGPLVTASVTTSNGTALSPAVDLTQFSLVGLVMPGGFTGTNGTALTAHAMDLGPGWAQTGPGTGVLNNNRGRLTGVLNNGTFFTGDFKQANVTVQAVMNYGASDDAGLAVRYQDASNYWAFDFNHAGQQAQLYETNAGSSIQRAAASTTIALGTDYAVRAVCAGQALQF